MGFFLKLYKGSNRGDPVTDGNPVPVKVMSGGGGGGGDATAAKQDEQTELLDDISAKLDAATAIDQTTPGTTNGVVILDSSGNAIDQSATVNVAQDVNAMKNGSTSLTPKFAKIAAASSGNNTVIAAVTGKKIRVLSYNFMGNGAVNAKFQDGAGGTDLTGLKYIAAAGQGISVAHSPVGWFETTANTLLCLNLSGAVAVGGEIVYVEV